MTGGLNPHGIVLPKPGESLSPFEGIALKRNSGNGFVVLRLHYTAEPSKRGGWRHLEAMRYGGIAGWKWRQEHEIDFSAVRGQLVFQNFDVRRHTVRPFTPPEHWPRWVMIDPGLRNPTSALWIAVDVDAQPDRFGNLPVHVYRELYRSGLSPGFVAKMVADLCHLRFGRSGRSEREHLESIILDPAARQEHQGAQNEDVGEHAESFVTKFQDAIDAMLWDVPVETGNNMKDQAIDEIVLRLGCLWMNREGVPLQDERGAFVEAGYEEIAAGAFELRPTLFFHRGCEATVAEMQKYRFSDWASSEVEARHNKKERPLDKDDHSVTNLIRFFNLMAGARGEGGPDLSDFAPRPPPRRVSPSDDERIAEDFDGIVGRHRKRRRARGGFR